MHKFILLTQGRDKLLLRIDEIIYTEVYELEIKSFTQPARQPRTNIFTLRPDGSVFKFSNIIDTPEEIYNKILGAQKIDAANYDIEMAKFLSIIKCQTPNTCS